MVGEFDAVTAKFRITRNRSRTSNYYDACQYLQYYYNNQPIPPSNIAKGKTSQVITSRHFSSLLFTSSFYNTHTHIQQLKISLHSSSFLTLTFIINWKATSHQFFHFFDYFPIFDNFTSLIIFTSLVIFTSLAILISLNSFISLTIFTYITIFNSSTSFTIPTSSQQHLFSFYNNIIPSPGGATCINCKFGHQFPESNQ